jgi:hypothetical protein
VHSEVPQCLRSVPVCDLAQGGTVYGVNHGAFRPDKRRSARPANRA